MIQIRNFINGQWQEETGGKTVPLYNPSTGETIGSVPVSNMKPAKPPSPPPPKPTRRGASSPSPSA